MATSPTFTTLTNAGSQCLRVYVSDVVKGPDGSAPFYDVGPATRFAGECADNQNTVSVSIGPGALLVIGRPANGSWFDNTQWFPIENYTANTVLTPPANNIGSAPPQMVFLDVNKGVITVGTTVAPPGFYDPPKPPAPPSPVDPSGSGGEYPYEPLPQPNSGIASWSPAKLWAVFGGIGGGIVILILVIVLPVMLVKKNPGGISGGGGGGGGSGSGFNA
jgi:hypothetical protein